jgi:hypothetical protein
MTTIDTTTEIDGSNSLADLAARIRIEHEACTTALKRGLQHAIAAGELLIEAKAKLNKHGRWLPWLRDHCVMPERTARLYMRLASNREQIGNVADLSIRGAIALLATPKGTHSPQTSRITLPTG